MAKVKGFTVLVKALSRNNSTEEVSPSPARNRSAHSNVVRKRPIHWKTVILMVGPFLLAFSFAIGHYVLFKYLDGRTVDSFPVRQSLVTTLSLLLVTGFRLSIVACVGLCFAQHLWHVLRKTAHPIYRIEQLFSIRSNPVVLANPKLLWTTPLLFSMAIYIWFIELAAVYPPGALNVISQPYSKTTNTNISVVNQPITNTVDPWKQNGTYPVLSELFVRASDNDESFPSIEYSYMAPLRSLAALSKFVMSSGRIIDMPPPVGQNMSYTLDFRGPQFSCKQNTVNSTMALPSPYETTVFNSTWDGVEGNQTCTYVLSQRQYFGYYVELNGTVKSGDDIFVLQGEQDKETRNITFVAQDTVLNCSTQSVLYKLNITYVKGVQQVIFNMSDLQPYTLADHGKFQAFDSNDTANQDPTLWGQNFTQWPQTLKSTLENWNVYAPLDALMRNMEYHWNLKTPVLRDEKPYTNFTLPNGTTVELYSLVRVEKANNNATLLQDSVFDTQRFNNTQPLGGDPIDSRIDTDNPFDPRNLTITEASLNDLLSNITVSTLFLDVQRAIVPVTVTDYQNTYEFSNRLSFFLPYALCLGIALLYVGIGIWALVMNGVPSTDGGFLQIMMATRGRTEMEKLVLEQGVVGTGELPKELLEMKIRFGELVGEEGTGMGMRRAVTFATIGETMPLRRRETSA